MANETWYRVSKMGRHITAFQVSHVADETILIERPSFGTGPLQLRVAKSDKYEAYYPTLDEAKIELTNLLTHDLSEALDDVNEIRAAIYKTGNLTAKGVQS